MQKIITAYTNALKTLVFALVYTAGISVLAMIIITCSDVILRRFGMPIKGAYDLVKVLGALTLACAMPYTTAVKGHVAIEYFFHKLNKKSRVIVDSLMRIVAILLFGFLGYRSMIYGYELFQNGQVSQTLQMPVFWVPYVIGISCFVVMLVISHNLIHPGREMIKP